MIVRLAEVNEHTSWMESETGFLVDRQKAETMHSSLDFILYYGIFLKE